MRSRLSFDTCFRASERRGRYFCFTESDLNTDQFLFLIMLLRIESRLLVWAKANAIQFRSYRLSTEFHHQCRLAPMPDYLKDQTLRASSSIALNLAEGSGRSSQKDQLRFFHMTLGSLRECQAAIDLSVKPMPALRDLADSLGAHLYRLCHRKKPTP